MKHTRNKCLTFDLELEGGEKTCRQFMTVPGRRDRAVSNHQGQYVHPAVKCPNHLFTLSQWLKLPNVCNNRSMIVCVCLYISLSLSMDLSCKTIFCTIYLYIHLYPRTCPSWLTNIPKPRCVLLFHLCIHAMHWVGSWGVVLMRGGGVEGGGKNLTTGTAQEKSSDLGPSYCNCTPTFQ